VSVRIGRVGQQLAIDERAAWGNQGIGIDEAQPGGAAIGSVGVICSLGRLSCGKALQAGGPVPPGGPFRQAGVPPNRRGPPRPITRGPWPRPCRKDLQGLGIDLNLALGVGSPALPQDRRRPFRVGLQSAPKGSADRRPRFSHGVAGRGSQESSWHFRGAASQGRDGRGWPGTTAGFGRQRDASFAGEAGRDSGRRRGVSDHEGVLPRGGLARGRAGAQEDAAPIWLVSWVLCLAVEPDNRGCDGCAGRCCAFAVAPTTVGRRWLHRERWTELAVFRSKAGLKRRH